MADAASRLPSPQQPQLVESGVCKVARYCCGVRPASVLHVTPVRGGRLTRKRVTVSKLVFAVKRTPLRPIATHHLAHLRHDPFSCIYARAVMRSPSLAISQTCREQGARILMRHLNRIAPTGRIEQCHFGQLVQTAGLDPQRIQIGRDGQGRA